MSDLFFKMLGASAIGKPEVGTVFVDSGDTRTTSLSNTRRNSVYGTFIDRFGNLIVHTEAGVYQCNKEDVNDVQLISNSKFFRMVYHKPSDKYFAESGYFVYSSTDLITWTLLLQNDSTLMEMKIVNDIIFVIPRTINQPNNYVYKISLDGNSVTQVFIYGNSSNYFINTFIANRTYIQGIEYDADANTYYAISSMGVSFKSTDNGTTWSKNFTNWPSFASSPKVWLPGIGKFIGVEFHNPDKPITFYDGTSESSILVPEFTASNVTVNLSSYIDFQYRLSFGDSNSSGSVIILTSSTSNRIIISTDSGITWNTQTLGSTTQYIQGVLYTGGNSFLIFQKDRIWKTNDNGTNWSTVITSINIDYAQIGIKPNSASHGDINTIVVGSRATNNNTILYSTDKGDTWLSYASPWGSGGLNAICWDGTNFVASGSSSGNFWTSSNGISWTDTGNKIPGPTAGVTYYAESIIYRNSTYFVFSTSSVVQNPVQSPFINHSTTLTSFTTLTTVFRSNRTPIIHASANLIYFDSSAFSNPFCAVINTNTKQFSTNYFPKFFTSNYGVLETTKDLNYYYAVFNSGGNGSSITTAYRTNNLSDSNSWVATPHQQFTFSNISLLSKDGVMYANQGKMYKYDSLLNTYTLLHSFDGISSSSTTAYNFTENYNKLYAGVTIRTDRYVLDNSNPVSGTTSGYISGGINPSNNISSIRKFPFSSPFVDSEFVGNLSLSKSFSAGNSSSNYGYNSGGTRPPFPSFTEIVDRFPFSTAFTTATNAGNLSQKRTGVAGISSSSNGYSVGGNIPTNGSALQRVNTIDSFPFSNSFSTATDVGDLDLSRQYITPNASITTGYATAGLGYPTATNRVDSFPFSSSFVTSTLAGSLGVSKGSATGNSSDTYGFISHGGDTSRLDRFPFSTPFTPSTYVTDLAQSKSFAAGCSSETHGHIVGGSTPTSPTTQITLIESYPFSSPSITSTTIGDITANTPSARTSAAAGHQD